MSCVLMRRAASDSLSPRALHRESTSSMKMMEGDCSRASWNSCDTSFSLSPSHLDTRSWEEMEKKVESASVATALARYDLPVPGGPYSRMPLQGLRLPVKNWGNLTGRMTASFRASLAPSSPATSSHLTFGFSDRMAPVSPALSLSFSLSSSFPPPAPGFRTFCAAAWPCSGPLLSCPATPFRYSARVKYSLNLALMASHALGFFSYFK
mmetsp:Transcript_16391/g.40867  ORF Transcript_16391/g.40867 Transcript_16391/m.40867 type:complete len:209 (+) Transcript_16391:1154-1780(+)